MSGQPLVVLDVAAAQTPRETEMQPAEYRADGRVVRRNIV